MQSSSRTAMQMAHQRSAPIRRGHLGAPRRPARELLMRTPDRPAQRSPPGCPRMSKRHGICLDLVCDWQCGQAPQRRRHARTRNRSDPPTRGVSTRSKPFRGTKALKRRRLTISSDRQTCSFDRRNCLRPLSPGSGGRRSIAIGCLRSGSMPTSRWPSKTGSTRSAACQSPATASVSASVTIGDLTRHDRRPHTPQQEEPNRHKRSRTQEEPYSALAQISVAPSDN
jgi:hypothetical protein